MLVFVNKGNISFDVSYILYINAILAEGFGLYIIQTLYVNLTMVPLVPWRSGLMHVTWLIN